MREIKFRGYRKDIGWKYGYYYVQREKHYIRPLDEEYISYAVNPESIGEYTGLKDKNGKEIYEGDIATFREHNHNRIGKIVWSSYNACWCSRFQFSFLDPMEVMMKSDGLYDYEVIGNIYENPELLETSNV